MVLRWDYKTHLPAFKRLQKLQIRLNLNANYLKKLILEHINAQLGRKVPKCYRGLYGRYKIKKTPKYYKRAKE